MNWSQFLSQLAKFNQREDGLTSSLNNKRFLEDHPFTHIKRCKPLWTHKLINENRLSQIDTVRQLKCKPRKRLEMSNSLMRVRLQHKGTILLHLELYSLMSTMKAKMLIT